MKVQIQLYPHSQIFQLDQNKPITTSTANYATSKAYDALFSQMFTSLDIEVKWCNRPNGVILVIKEKDSKAIKSAPLYDVDLSNMDGIKSYISRAYYLIRENLGCEVGEIDLSNI